MATQRRKFASQMDATVLSQLKAIADKEGRLFQAVLEEAVMLYIDTKQSQKPRETVMAHFRASMERNRRLLELLS